MRHPGRAAFPLLVLALHGLGAVPAVGSVQPAVVERALAEAERALAVDESQLAESRFRDAVYEGWLVLAALAERRGDPAAARSAFERAIESRVETRRARLALAALLADSKEIDEAERTLRSLIADDAGDAEARRLLASILAGAGRLDEAVREIEQLHFLDPANPENAYLLATAYLKQGRLEAADELLAKLATAIPTAQTHILIGRTYRDAEHFQRARRAFETALELDPGVRRAHYYLGSVHLLESGAMALAEAGREFERELRVDPEDEMTNLYLGMARVEERRYAEAIPPLEIASRRRDVSPDALRFLGRALLETGRVDEAIATLRRGLAALAGADGEPPAEPGEFEARQLSSLHYQLAQALRRGGDRDGADFHFAAAKKYQARSAETARESLDRYLRSETASGPLTTGSGAAPVIDGDADHGERQALRRAVETAVARAYYNLGVQQMRAAAHRRAADLFARGAELVPELPDLQYSLGVARFNAGEFAAATSPLEKALGSRPQDENLEQMLALAWLNSGRYERAAAALAELPSRDSNPGLQYAYGLALVRADRAAEAEAVFLELLRDNAEWPELNVVLGQAFAQQGNFPSAIDAIRRALRLDPLVAEAHATLGEIHLRRGELAEAETELRAELRHHPDDSRARYTLATVLDLAQKPEEAMELLRSLLAEEPDLAKARYLLGKILLAGGDPRQAREQLEAAAGLAPEDANIRYQLGQAYQKLGRTADAREQFETFRALKRRPAGEDG